MKAVLRAGVIARLVLVVGLMALLSLPGAPAAAGSSTTFLNVRIDSITPDVVTSSSPATLRVSGTVTNVGNRTVRDVVARLEHGAAVTSSAALRTSLAGADDEFEAASEFITVTGQLERGQTAVFTLTVAIGAGPQPSLGVTEPGVYPMLVNVNGIPDDADEARLDEDRFLLPVAGVPPASPAGNPIADAVAPDTSKPLEITMFWPLADKPRLAPGLPGGTTPVRLMDDDLAVSLATGGRLDTLLAAAEFATSPGAIDPNAGVDRTLCLAVDPDLVVTVNAMTAGYVVADSPDGLGPASHPGTGQAAAVAWLDRLRRLADKLCVVATPYAQADLGALDRVGDALLSAAATITAADIVDKILDVVSVRGITVLGDGALSADALRLLNTETPTVAVAAAQSPEDTPDLAMRRLSEQVVFAPFDPAVGGALAGIGTDPGTPTYLDESLAVPVAGDSPVARRQSAVAAILWRALQPDVLPRSQILLPPLKWSPQPDDARAVLSALASSVRSGLAKPRPLKALLAQATAAGPASAEQQGVPATRGRFDDDVVATIAEQVRRLAGLTEALTTDSRTGLTGLQYTAPLREDMLRALSLIEPPASRNDIARLRLPVVGRTIEDLFHAVSIVNPGDTYTLATERSALPLALRNDLAVPIRVRLQVDAPPGMTVTDIGEQELPPGYLPLRVPVELHVSQRVAVDVTLRTAEGLQLGEPVRLSVHSNAYGKLLFALTLGGGVVLALLVGRRLYHRFRGQPDRADLDRPWHPIVSTGSAGVADPRKEDR